MGQKKVAVAVIHGMGAQEWKARDDTGRLTFSKGMHRKISNVLGTKTMADVAWREIHWQDILQERQGGYFRKIKSFNFIINFVKKFVLYRLSDAGSYKKTHDANEKIYQRIHARMTDTMKALRKDVKEDTPLLIVAHSLGAQVVSNYIYDMWPYEFDPNSTAKPRKIELVKIGKDDDGNKFDRDMTPTFSTMATLSKFFTFGCNIPVFIFAYEPTDIKPVRPPISWDKNRKIDQPWWTNYYDTSDILAYPLRPVGGAYEDLIDAKHISENRIHSGPPIPIYRFFKSHNAYWTDRDVFVPIANEIAGILCDDPNPLVSVKPGFKG